MSVTLDASVWLAAQFPSEPGHASALALLSGVVRAGVPLHQPTLFLAEVAGAIRRRTGSWERAAEAIAQIAALPSLALHALDAATAKSAAAMAGGLGLRGADAVYLATGAAVGNVLITLDLELQQRGMGAAPVLTPAEWLAANPPG